MGYVTDDLNPQFVANVIGNQNRVLHNNRNDHHENRQKRTGKEPKQRIQDDVIIGVRCRRLYRRVNHSQLCAGESIGNCLLIKTHICVGNALRKLRIRRGDCQLYNRCILNGIYGNKAFDVCDGNILKPAVVGNFGAKIRRSKDIFIVFRQGNGSVQIRTALSGRNHGGISVACHKCDLGGILRHIRKLCRRKAGRRKNDGRQYNNPPLFQNFPHIQEQNFNADAFLLGFRNRIIVHNI